jgi:hypothetical protein
MAQTTNPNTGTSTTGTNTVWDIIKYKAQQYGVSMGLLAPIILMESGGDPHASNPSGARGLLQLLPNGGQGSGMTVEQLNDPAANLDRGLPYIKAAQQKALALGLDPHSVNFLNYVLSHSGHTNTTGVLDKNQTDADKIADSFWNLPSHGVNKLKAAASKFVGNPNDLKYGTNPNDPNSPTYSGTGGGSGETGGFADDITIHTPFGDVSIPNPSNAIANAIEAPFLDFRAFLFDHALESVILVLAVLILIGAAIGLFRKGL